MENNRTFNSVTLIILLWNWRFRIIILLIATIIISSVVSLLMQEKFKSTAVIFPAKSNSVVLGKMLNPSQSVLSFGEEEEAEQTLQILNSAMIRDRIITKYNLMQHYEIDTSGKYKYTNLHKQYEENVKCSRTRYGSINIEVLDTDPDTAALIANDIVAFLDSAKNKMMHDRALQAFAIVEQEYLGLKTDIDRLNDTLTKLGQMGVVGSSVGQAALMESYSNALRDRNTGLVARLEPQIEMNKKYGTLFSSFSEQRELKNMRMDEMEETYKQARADAFSPLSYKFLVEPAMKAEKKAYPVRWLIVFISTVSAFFFMVFLIIALEKLKELRSYQKA
jgi:uncharacterized protein involved in exopolysaccharide biosynthesis